MGAWYPNVGAAPAIGAAVKTQAEFSSLTPDANTVYVIVEESEETADAVYLGTRKLWPDAEPLAAPLAATGSVSGYEDMTVTELKDELDMRGLVVSGNKAELVARLEEDDA